MPIKNSILEGSSGYLVYFDDVRFDMFVKDYTVNLYTDGAMGSAALNLIYVPDFDIIVHNPSKQATSGSSVRTSTSKGTVYNISSYLSVRSGPSTSYSRIGKLWNGEVVTINKEENGFYNVTYNLDSGGTKTGWASASYIRKNGSSAPSSSSSTGNNVKLNVEHGIENMTTVRVFSKNMFNGLYNQIFEGNVRNKSLSISGGERTISIQCTDYMNWLNRTICPIAVPFDGTLTNADVLRWKAQGIDLDNVKTVQSVADITFKGKNIAQTWAEISNQTIKANKLFSSPDTVAQFDKPLERVTIMGDIDENLRRAEVMDFMITHSATSVNTIYVMINDILRTLMFEFYQDRDGAIRIKPPFWNEHVLKNHVIDPSLILDFNSSHNFNNQYTRVIATGALEDWQQEIEDDLVRKMITPVVVVTSGGVTANSGPVVITSRPTGGSGGSGGSGSNGGSGGDNGGNGGVDGGSSALGERICKTARTQLGKPYIWGGCSPSQGGFDCSGIIYWSYRQHGQNVPRVTYDQIKGGREVSGKHALMPGDMIFQRFSSRGPEHVVMYSGRGRVIEAPRTGQVLKEYTGFKWEGRARRYLKDGRSLTPQEVSREVATYSPSENFKNINTRTPGEANTSEKPSDVGPDSLLQPTDLEKKYGPLIYEVTQPLIKFSTSGATNSDSAYDALSKYAKFMLNFLNSTTSMASIRTVSMPWLRPGFNIWIDPAAIDKVYYISNITHVGSANGCFTSMSLILGRNSNEFLNNKDSLGALKPGASDDIFVNKLHVTAKDFGEICDYTNIKNKERDLYINSGGTIVSKAHDRNTHFFNLYGNGATGITSSNSSSSSSSSNSSSSSSSGNSSGVTYNIRSFLNVRTGPSTSYSIKGKIWNNEVVTIHKEENGFYYVTYPLDRGGTKTGWASANYIKKTGRSTASRSGGTNGTVYNVSSYLNVRSGAGTAYSVIGKVFNNESVNVLKESGGFYNITYNNGSKSGWVSSQYIRTSFGGSSNSSASSRSSNDYSHSTSSIIFDKEYTISEIESRLNSLYRNAPPVVKERSQKIRNIKSRGIEILKKMALTEVEKLK